MIGLPLYLEDDAFSEQNPGLGGFLHGLLGGLVKSAAISGYGVHVTTPTEGATEIALYEKLIAARQVDAIVVLETKAALNALALVYASALRADGVKVNAANPGLVPTDLNSRASVSRGDRTTADGALVPVLLATLPEDGPSGQFRGPGSLDEEIPW